MREVLELSVYEMKKTVAELEKRLDYVEDEDNEWKTRYETQIELNRQIERQIGLLQVKMDHVRGSPTDRLASVRSFDQMHMEEETPHSKPDTDIVMSIVELIYTTPKLGPVNIENRASQKGPPGPSSLTSGTSQLRSRHAHHVDVQPILEHPYRWGLNDLSQPCPNPLDSALVYPKTPQFLHQDIMRHFVKGLAEIQDSLNLFLKKLGEEKESLRNQLKDYELRLEQEAKAYHKANDERRAYLAVMSQVSPKTSLISGSHKPLERQKMEAVEMKRENQLLSQSQSLQHHRQGQQCFLICLHSLCCRGRCNIPRNQRILDPKKGPIKKTAGVKQLPKLNL
ncbi:hypothetical protein EYD10_03470 [Varanus komodoensis]|nr:hypothetical protein EYD10_03470 [Varanus komodoensis]